MAQSYLKRRLVWALLLLSPVAAEPDWSNGQWTSPTQHDARSFRYLIHGVNPFMRELFQKAHRKAGTYQAERDIDLLVDPDGLRRKPWVFASVVDQDHRAVFSRTFFILNAPPEAVLNTSARDTEAMRPQLGNALLDPLELLRRTRASEHNEVTLSAPSLKVVGVGLVAVETPHGPDYPEQSERLREIAEERSIPCVE